MHTTAWVCLWGGDETLKYGFRIEYTWLIFALPSTAGKFYVTLEVYLSIVLAKISPSDIELT